MDRLIKSLIGAPIIGFFIGDIAHYLIYKWGFGYFTLLNVMVFYPLLFLLAIPTYHLLRRLKLFSIWGLLVVGTLLVIFSWTILFWPIENNISETKTISFGLCSIFSGIIASCLVYFIGVKNNVDLASVR